MLQREQELHDQHQHQSEQQHALKCQEQMNIEMHGSLESLFGDMVKLAQMYEHLEKEGKLVQEKHQSVVDKMEKKLRGYHERAGTWEEKRSQLLYENDATAKKYANAREKKRAGTQSCQAFTRRKSGTWRTGKEKAQWASFFH